MDQDLNNLVFELLATLSEATKKIGEKTCPRSAKSKRQWRGGRR